MKISVGTSRKPWAIWVGGGLAVCAINAATKSVELDNAKEAVGYYGGLTFFILAGVALALWGYYGLTIER